MAKSVRERRVAAQLFAGLVAVVVFWVGNTACAAARAGYAREGLFGALTHVNAAFRHPRIGVSLAWQDLTAGLVAVMVVLAVVALVRLEQGQRRSGEEHGSARWGKPAELRPFASKQPERNLLLTRQLRLSLDRPDRIEFQRNLNVMCIGASGSGKSRFFIMPNLYQAQSSYLVTDPKGELLSQSGRHLLEAGYQIRVLNLVDFAQSDSFNPLRYLRAGHEPEDVGLLVRNIMANTDNGRQAATGEGGFWERAEAALLNALISFVAATYEPADRHLGSVVDLLAQMQAVDGQQSPVDLLFQQAGEMVAEDASMPQADLLRYALSQYRSYAQAADKTASSIIVTTAVRLAPLHIPALRRLVEHDTLGLDRVGFEKTALFMVISDSDRQFSWLAALVFSMFFQRGIHLADQQEGRRLPVPVQCWMDEFANIGRIPDFDVLAATLRSRGISFAGVIQNVGQGKQLYRDGWNAILGNCDTVLFLGSADAETREYVSKALGRQTIVTTDSSSSRGRNSSTSRNRKTLGRELLSPDEVGRLPGNEAIVLVRGLPPFRDDKLAPVAESVPYTHQPGWNTRSWQ